MEAALAEVEEQLALARAGGGERYVERHRSRGKLLARERVELLLDRDSPFLEIAPLAAWGTDYTVGASLVSGIGVVSGVECLVSANDPTVRGGATNPFTMRKSSRLADIALENRLPSISLVESGGADLPTQSEIFIPGGRGFRDLTQRSAAGAPHHRPGLRELHRRRRVRPGHERPHRDDRGALQGVPGGSAAREDGHRRGIRRRGARRGRPCTPG